MSSVSDTSASEASINTWIGVMSSRRSAVSMTENSFGVA